MLSASETGDRWYEIGLFDLIPGDTVTLIEAEDEPDRFYVDAIKLVRYGAPEQAAGKAAESEPMGKARLHVWSVMILYAMLLIVIVAVLLGALIVVRTRQ